MKITVTLNNGALTVTPDGDQVGTGSSTIKWVKGSTSDNFRFTGLTGLSEHNPPFSGQNVADTQITINDDNTGIYSNRDYPYGLTVYKLPDGPSYNVGSANGNPNIHNM